MKSLKRQLLHMPNKYLSVITLNHDHSLQKKSLLEVGNKGRECVSGPNKSFEDFSYIYALIMKTYNSYNVNLHFDHLGLKKLCVP